MPSCMACNSPTFMTCATVYRWPLCLSFFLHRASPIHLTNGNIEICIYLFDCYASYALLPSTAMLIAISIQLLRFCASFFLLFPFLFSSKLLQDIWVFYIQFHWHFWSFRTTRRPVNYVVYFQETYSRGFQWKKFRVIDPSIWFDQN